jgi:hypothetical protein
LPAAWQLPLCQRLLLLTDAIPVGPGSSISPPGLQSEVSSYLCAVCEVDVVFDLVG